MKKAVSLILALVMLLLVASFAEKPATNFALEPYEDAVKISLLSTDQKAATTEYDSSNPERRSASENAWISCYKDYLNIEVERIMAEDETALNARINTGMAGEDLPDAMIVGKAMLAVLAENDVLMDLTETYNEFGHTEWLDVCLQGSNGAIEKGMFGGKLLGFPIVGNSFNSSDVLWIRNDWLDAVGMEAPATLDDMVSVAKAFQEAQLGGENTIGLGITDVSASIAAAYGVVMGTWDETENGEFVFANTKPEMKEALLFMQKLYDEGIIKSDFAVSNLLAEEVANGVCGMFYGPAWAGSTDVKANQLNDADADWTAVPIPTLNGERVKQWTNDAVGSYVVVNKNCEHPEAIFKMLELELYQQYAGSTEERLKYLADANSYQIWDFRVFRNMQMMDYDLNRSRMLIKGIENNTPVEDVPYYFQATYGRCKTVWENKEAGLEYDRSRLGLTIVFTTSYKILNQLLDDGLLVGAYDGKLTEAMSLYEASINTALNNAMLKVIMGEDISVFDEAVETWYTTGGQDITDDVNAYYDSI